MQFTSLAELFQHSKGIGQRFHLLKWLSQRANLISRGLKGLSWVNFPGSRESLSGVGRDKVPPVGIHTAMVMRSGSNPC